MADENIGKCIQDEVLSAWLDGELSDSQSRLVQTHLQQCHSCRQAKEELQAICDELRPLAKVEDCPDLWNQIVAEHQQDKKSTWFEGLSRFWLVPSAALVGAAASFLLWMFWFPMHSSSDLDQTQVGPLVALNKVLQAEQTYSAAIDALQSAMGEQKQNPQIQKALEQGLADIDQTIRKCRELLHKNPNDLQAYDTMLAAYQHKVDLLTDMLGQNL